MQVELDDLYTTNQVCAMFQITRSGLVYWRHFLNFPTLQLGGRGQPLRFEREALRTWAKTHNKHLRENFINRPVVRRKRLVT